MTFLTAGQWRQAPACTSCAMHARGHADGRVRDRGIRFERTLDRVGHGGLDGQRRIAELDIDGNVVAGDPDAAQRATGDEIDAGVRIGHAGQDAAGRAPRGFRIIKRESCGQNRALCQRRALRRALTCHRRRRQVATLATREENAMSLRCQMIAFAAALACISVPERSPPNASPAGILEDHRRQDRPAEVDRRNQRAERPARPARSKEVLQSDQGPNPVCKECEGERKNQPVTGMTIIWGMKKNADEWSGGQILDPKNGKIYGCKMHPR